MQAETAMKRLFIFRSIHREFSANWKARGHKFADSLAGQPREVNKLTDFGVNTSLNLSFVRAKVIHFFKAQRFSVEVAS